MARSKTFIERSKEIADAKLAVPLSGWKTLEESRELAMAQGCTGAQFAVAVETVGSDPPEIADYLQRNAFIRRTSTSDTQIHKDET